MNDKASDAIAMDKINLALVVSRFNDAITQRLYQSATNRLSEFNIASHQVTTLWVPGAVEIPLVADALARKGELDAIICLGAVIRGETGHYDWVCQQVSQGVQRVMLDYHLPVVFGVLTTENKEQAMARSGGKHSDVGRSSVDTAIEMANCLSLIELSS